MNSSTRPTYNPVVTGLYVGLVDELCITVEYLSRKTPKDLESPLHLCYLWIWKFYLELFWMIERSPHEFACSLQTYWFIVDLIIVSLFYLHSLLLICILLIAMKMLLFDSMELNSLLTYLLTILHRCFKSRETHDHFTCITWRWPAVTVKTKLLHQFIYFTRSLIILVTTRRFIAKFLADTRDYNYLVQSAYLAQIDGLFITVRKFESSCYLLFWIG